MRYLTIKGARAHNLKNIELKLPKNKLIVFTGVSGSGKTSLAFDTIYAEGQRRYVESLSSYARQFLGVMKKPDVDLIEGLSPAISVNQKSITHNPRSTIGTITEIYDYLRLLYARVGHPHCPVCGQEISRQSVNQMVDNAIFTIKQEASTGKFARFFILSPVVRDRKGEFNQLFSSLRQKGFVQARIDGAIFDLTDGFQLIKTNRHTIEVVTDKLTLESRQLKDVVSFANIKNRLREAFEKAVQLSEGLAVLSFVKDPSFEFPVQPEKFADHLYSQKFSCPKCNVSLPEIEPRDFSFNSPHGACPICNGIGTLLKVDRELVVNPRLSVTEGGVLAFNRIGKSTSLWGKILQKVAQEDGFSLRVPIGEMKKENLNKVLYGTGERKIRIKGRNRKGEYFDTETTFEGVIPNLERRYKETESSYIRREIGKYMRKEKCPKCQGKRLKKEILSITIDEKSIAKVSSYPIKKLNSWLSKVKKDQNILSEKEKTIAALILKDLLTRLKFLISVGLDYPSIDRPTESLAGGEAQRIRLASQIGTGLSGVLYVLDEPTIGLHQRDNKKLINTLKELRDLGNTVIVIEHDREMIENADLIVDFGPRGGEEGGQIVAQGSLEEIIACKKSITGKYLSGEKKVNICSNSKIIPSKFIALKGCSQYNLKNIDVAFPLNRFICVTGVSGSGKSTLVEYTLYRLLASHFQASFRKKPGEYREVVGLDKIDKVMLVDQSPVGRTPRSNPATYTGVFDYIRKIYSQTPEAKVLGFNQGRFSFNTAGGRCETCRGMGETKIEMQFLPDVYVECDVCHGKRYTDQVLEIRYKGKNIAQVLNMSVDQAKKHFKNVPGLSRKLQILIDVGLGYIALGQPSPTLSGGESQRLKLARQLAKRQKGHTVYILDEPTTGLHFDDIKKLLKVLSRFVDRGNTVIVIEHNLEVIKNADWIIDLGPEGGSEGGYKVAVGPREKIISSPKSYTGAFLKTVMK